MRRFTYLSSVREDRPQFVKILKRLIVNLQVRFYTPSSSLDKRTVGGFLDYDHVFIRPDVPTGDCSRCSLIPQFKLFNIRQTRQITIDLSRLLGLRLDEEMENLMSFSMTTLASSWAKRRKGLQHVLPLKGKCAVFWGFQPPQTSMMYCVRLKRKGTVNYGASLYGH